MSLPAWVTERLSTEFRRDIAENPGSRILSDGGDKADFVDLYIYPKERIKGKEWELILVVDTKDGALKANGVGIHAAFVKGGSYEYLGSPAKPEGHVFPSEILDIAADMSARVARMVRERGLMDAIREIAKARTSGDEDSLDQAISSATSMIVEIDPSMSEGLEEAPSPSMTR